MDYEPPRVNPRPGRALACLPCRKKKLRCDHQHPCSNCMRSRSKICSYPKPKDGSTAIISASVSSRDDETARKSPPNLANGKDEEQGGSKENESTRCDVWHSGALGSVLVSIPPESRLDLDAASYLPISGSPLRDSGRSSTGDLHSHSNLPTCLDSYPIRGMMIKKRYISPTHWMFSLTLVR